ncbi:hypothetical protein EJ06DRAFT_469374 [Trichodelitschia bisporula]|uniref:ApbA-domain-containing protein n=1 Tax=Trichodelitschia bisporula TaxID=703511 RepID=A0A6G1I7S3_9PEZI|nr:hypothetical protein EJ06DRAFT_469374 [Trichodelitschia bisporula]
MAPTAPRLRILSVGGNAVSAFLSWRLQATNACDVTLVWKAQYEAVAQYGIAMKSQALGNERFLPHSVIQSTEEASHNPKSPFDYVLLCVKALPDIYDLAKIIEPVVTPQHTCILLNTTTSLGVEEYLVQRFPTNVVLSLVCGADLAQLGADQFEHRGSATDISVGWANKNSRIPESIQRDMAEALAMTLTTGRVNCTVSENIRQQQFERVIGPIAFHPASVLFECPNHAELLEIVGVRDIVNGAIDELLAVAAANGCTFPPDFKETTMENMIRPGEVHGVMYQDFVAGRPMEVETYLGSPVKLAREAGVSVPRLETLYALLRYKNANKPNRPPISPGVKPPPRSSSVAGYARPVMNGNGPMNGMGRGRAPSMQGPPSAMRRGPPQPNGYGPRIPNGIPNGHGPGPSNRGSLEGDNLEEFSHLMLYDNIPEGASETLNGVYAEGPMQNGASTTDLALRERELQLRQRELELRERQMAMGRAPPRGRPGPPPVQTGFEDDEDDDDFIDPNMARAPNPAIMDENFDMMSITSRRNRKGPSTQNANLRYDNPPVSSRGRNLFMRNKNRTSTRLMADVPGLHDSLMNNPMLGYSSNRYGNVDRAAMGQESRQNSLTSTRLEEIQRNAQHGPYPPRRQSASPGNPLGPPKRPSPPNGFSASYPNGSGPYQHGGAYPNGPYPNGIAGGRPSPPGMRQPVPRHPPGHGNAVAPQAVEQHIGSLYPQKQPGDRSLTGSASASAESGDSGASGRIDSSNSSANSSLGLPPRQVLAA